MLTRSPSASMPRSFSRCRDSGSTSVALCRGRAKQMIRASLLLRGHPPAQRLSLHCCVCVFEAQPAGRSMAGYRGGGPQPLRCGLVGLANRNPHACAHLRNCAPKQWCPAVPAGAKRAQWWAAVVQGCGPSQALPAAGKHQISPSCGHWGHPATQTTALPGCEC